MHYPRDIRIRTLEKDAQYHVKSLTPQSPNQKHLFFLSVPQNKGIKKGAKAPFNSLQVLTSSLLPHLNGLIQI